MLTHHCYTQETINKLTTIQQSCTYLARGTVNTTQTYCLQEQYRDTINTLSLSVSFTGLNVNQKAVRTVAWKGHTLQFTDVTSTKQPSRLQFTTCFVDVTAVNCRVWPFQATVSTATSTTPIYYSVPMKERLRSEIRLHKTETTPSRDDFDPLPWWRYHALVRYLLTCCNVSVSVNVNVNLYSA